MSSKIKKDLALKKTALRDQEKENTSVQEQLKHSEDDLKHAKRKIASLHKKLKKLQEALDSPSETGRVLRTGWSTRARRPLRLLRNSGANLR